MQGRKGAGGMREAAAERDEAAPLMLDGAVPSADPEGDAAVSRGVADGGHQEADGVCGQRSHYATEQQVQQNVSHGAGHAH